MIPITSSGRSRSAFELGTGRAAPFDSNRLGLSFEQDMPGARLPMRKIRDVLRLTAAMSTAISR